MKRVMHATLLAGLSGVVIAFGATRAEAIPFVSVVNPDPNIPITTTTPYSYQHVIAGFDSSTDTVINALLAVVLSDDGASEGIRYNLEGLIADQNNTGNVAKTYTFDFGDLGILATLANGTLDLTLSATSGSYIFNESSLTGEFTRSTITRVPEPSSLILLAAGLVGLGARRRMSAQTSH